MSTSIDVGMFATMPHHAGTLRERLSADIALEWFIARVNDPVNLESPESRESLWTRLTLVGPFTGVHALMQPQRKIRRELHAALGAQECLRVQFRVITKIHLRDKSLFTNAARILLRYLTDPVHYALVRGQM